MRYSAKKIGSINMTIISMIAGQTNQICAL